MVPSRDRRYIIGMSAALVLIAAGVATARYAKPIPVAVDGDFCPAVPVGTWLVLTDITDVPPPLEQQRIVAAMQSIADRMLKHERLALHAFGASSTQAATPMPVPGLSNGFNHCKSADPKSIDRTFENERKVRAVYQRTFFGPLTEAATHLARGGRAPFSPILESIDVAAWAPHFRNVGARRTLVLISDLEQNSDALSFLGAARPDACVLVKSPLGQRLAQHHWSNVTLQLIYIRTRERQQQNAEHLRFFAELFHLLGVAEVLDGTTTIPKPNGLCAAPPAPKTKSTRTTRKG